MHSVTCIALQRARLRQGGIAGSSTGAGAHWHCQHQWPRATKSDIGAGEPVTVRVRVCVARVGVPPQCYAQQVVHFALHIRAGPPSFPMCLASIAAISIQVYSAYTMCCALRAAPVQVGLQPGLEDVLADVLEYEGADDDGGAEFYIGDSTAVDGECGGSVRQGGLVAGSGHSEL